MTLPARNVTGSQPYHKPGYCDRCTAYCCRRYRGSMARTHYGDARRSYSEIAEAKAGAANTPGTDAHSVVTGASTEHC